MKTLLAALVLSLATFASSYADLQIVQIEADSPDFVLIKNTGSASASLTGYTLVEDDSAWAFPEGTTIASGGTLKVYCYSKKKKLAEGRQAAAKWAGTAGVLVSIEFGISDQELVELKDASGKVVSSATGSKK